MSVPLTKAVVITGASSGIGRASVSCMVQSGWRVFATVRKTRDGDRWVRCCRTDFWTQFAFASRACGANLAQCRRYYRPQRTSRSNTQPSIEWLFSSSSSQIIQIVDGLSGTSVINKPHASVTGILQETRGHKDGNIVTHWRYALRDSQLSALG